MIKNIYLRCALVLSCICVGSAVLIGGLNTVAEIYKANHKSTEAPAEIQDLRPGATFEEVDGFQPLSSTENSTKVTIQAVYALKSGNQTTGYAYKLNCSKPVKTDVEFTVLFEGPATAANINSIKPAAINVVVGGDSGYDGNVIKLADAVVAGTASVNDYSAVVSGGTKSQKFFIDGVQAARKDYVGRINGETGGQTTEKSPIEKIYGEKYKSFAEDEFTSIKADTEHCSYEITNRYTVTLTDATVTKAYAGTASFIDPEGETDVVKIVAAFSGDKTSVKLDGYNVTKSISWDDYKGYLDGVSAGTTSLEDENAVHTGSTLSTNAIRDLVLGMRADYIVNYKTTIEEMVGSNYLSESVDEYGPVTGSTSHSSYELTKRYTVEMADGTKAKAYEGTASFKDPEGETDVLKLIAVFGGDAANAKLLGYKMTKNISWDDYKGYLSNVKDGKTSLDDENAVHTGSTLSTNAIRDILLAMRTDFIASLSA